MNQPDQNAVELADLLAQHLDEIASDWADLIHQIPSSHYRTVPQKELNNSTRRALKAMLEALATGSHNALKKYLKDISLTRLSKGFRAAEVTQALLLCKDAVVPVIFRAYPLDSVAIRVAIAQVDACQRWTAGHFNELYASETSKRLQQERERLALMLETAQKASSSLELDEVLSHITKTLTSALNRQYCIVAMVDNDREQLTFRPSGILDATAQEIAWDLGYYGREFPFSQLASFSRQVIRDRKPLTTYNAEDDPRIPAELVRKWGSKSWLGLPFVVGQKVVALAWMFTREVLHQFTQDEIDLAMGIASVMGLSIENARLHQQVRQMAIVEERERLAREMHDGISQILGAVNWQASTIDRLVANGQIDEARSSLSELKLTAKKGYTDVRETIFTLRSSASLDMEFLPALDKFLYEYQMHYGLRVELDVDSQCFPTFPVEVRLQIIRIIQEALSNVRRHATASHARVAFREDKDGMYLTVEDDGEGFDLAQVESQGQHQFGLMIMRERAETLGGSLLIESHPGRGVRIEARLPLHTNEWGSRV